MPRLSGPAQGPPLQEASHRLLSVPFQKTSCSPEPCAATLGLEPSGPMPRPTGPCQVPPLWNPSHKFGAVLKSATPDTVTWMALLVDGSNAPLSPAYEAVRLCVPARRALVASAARPCPSSGAVPRALVPSRKVRLPAGVPVEAETEAERAIGVPGATVGPSGEAARLVCVLHGPLFCTVTVVGKAV